MARRQQKWRAIGMLLAGLAGVSVSGPGAAGQAGDADRGAELYSTRCGACHSIDRHRIGPLHRDVVGRTAGSAPGYRYSKALKDSDVVWDAESLDRWLANPEAFIPGQKMGYRLADATERRDIIAYLRRLDASERPRAASR